MLKKIILASAIALMTTGAAIAQGTPYVGASVGITTNTANVKMNGSNFTGGGYRGIPANLFAGYGGLIAPNLYLAGEVNGTLSTTNISDNTQLKTSYGLGASIIPGVMLSRHTMAYARVGVVRSDFSYGDTLKTGGQVGLGMQTCLAQNLDLRGEYDFVSYQAKHFTYNRSTASLTPQSDQFSVGLVYKLD